MDERFSLNEIAKKSRILLNYLANRIFFKANGALSIIDQKVTE